MKVLVMNGHKNITNLVELQGVTRCIVAYSLDGVSVIVDEGKTVAKMKKELFKAFGYKYDDFKVADFEYDRESGEFRTV